MLSIFKTIKNKLSKKDKKKAQPKKGKTAKK